jgi:hypothetical protein
MINGSIKKPGNRKPLNEKNTKMSLLL